MSTLRERVAGDHGQLALWDGERLRRQFEQHRKDHPWVWTALVTMARQVRARGRKRFGIAALYELARWNTPGQEYDDQGWKLNNSLRAYYARALMAEEPELAGLFETRRLRAV